MGSDGDKKNFWIRPYKNVLLSTLGTSFKEDQLEIKAAACVYVGVCMCVCTCVCVSERERDRQRERERERRGLKNIGIKIGRGLQSVIHILISLFVYLYV